MFEKSKKISNMGQFKTVISVQKRNIFKEI